MHAVMYEDFGEAEVLQWRKVDDPRAGPDEVLVRIEAAGLNFADIYRRRGRWRPAGPPPWIPGYEAAGVVESVGPGAAAGAFKPGDRVGFADAPRANAQLAAVPAENLIALPAAISTSTAAAVLLQGLTAHYLARDSHDVRPGQWVVVHAAAGGVGLLLVQIARRLGARVIGLASSPEKQAAAVAAGADHALGHAGWVEAVRELTGGGADVVYDSIGTTLNQSLAALRPRGRAVFFGMAGGDPDMVDPRVLMESSLSLVGGDLWNVLVSAEERRRRAGELFSWIEDGSVRPTIAASLPMSRAAEAHRLLESRRVIGKVLLLADPR